MMVYSIIFSGFLSHNWTSKYIMVFLLHRYRQSMFMQYLQLRLYRMKINVLALHMVMQNENQCSNIT